MNIPKYNLGKTDIEITPIGLGTWQFAGGIGVDKLFWSGTPTEEKNKIVKQAIDGGINWFDTAQSYGSGKSEEFLSNGLRNANISDEEIIISNKWYPLFKTARNIGRSINTRLKKLNPYSIDLYHIHQPFSLSSVKAEMNAMADLVDKEKIGSVGISNFSVKNMRKAEKVLTKRGYCLASHQVRYNLLDRSIEKNGILDTAKELGITIIAWSPLSMVILTGIFHEDPNLLKSIPFARRRMLKGKIDQSKILLEELGNIAETHNVSIAQVSLNWLVNFHGKTVVAIPGAMKAEHVQDSAGVMKFKLSQNELNTIDEFSK